MMLYVVCFLKEELTIKKSQYSSKEEKDVEGTISRQLGEKYGSANVHRQYSVGGFSWMKCDIDLFDSKCCGIELKLAKQFKDNSRASAYERLIGQIVYYSKRCYRDRLIVLVVGYPKDYDAILQEVEKFVRELGLGVHFVFKEVV